MIKAYDWMTDGYITCFDLCADKDEIETEMKSRGYEQGDYYLKVIN